MLAVYPVAQASLNTESEIENAAAKPLNRAMVKWFVDHLVRTPADTQDTRLQLVAQATHTCRLSDFLMQFCANRRNASPPM